MTDDQIWEVLPFDAGTFSLTGEANPPPEQQGVIVAHALRARDGQVFLFDTGIAEGDPDLDAKFHPVERPLEEALTTVGIDLSEIVAATNCHLHPDHAGQNLRLANVAPIYVQSVERRLANEPGQTIPRFIEGPGVDYIEIEGDREVLPGIRILATPGHTAGHQSLLVMTRRGRVLLAGQAVYTLDEWVGRPGRHGRAHSQDVAAYDASFERLRRLSPAAVHFAHDRRSWPEATGKGAVVGPPA